MPIPESRPGRRLTILLVRPRATYAGVLAGIPIGLALLAAVAEQKGHEVRILDEGLEGDPDAALAAALGRGRCDIAGIGCMSVEFLGAIDAARAIRRLSPSTHIIFGGHHPTILPDQVIADPAVDSLCIGEGEAVWSEFLDRMAAGAGLEGLEGLWFRAGGAVAHNARRSGFVDVDLTPLPAYHLLDIDRYLELDFVRFPTVYRRALQIFTSRGCPYRCIFCHDLFGKRFRGRRPESVLEEIRLLHDRYGIREFMVEDDIFNMDIGRAKRICELIIASGMRIGLQFGNGIRVERCDEELIDLMARAGTHAIALAVESSSPRVQAIIRKNLKLDQVESVVDWSRARGIRTMGFFMLGFPGETVAEIDATIRYACRSRFDEALFSIATPYAGTELHARARDAGAREESGDVRDELEGVFRIRTDEWDTAALRRLQRKAYLKFFASRFRFLRVLADLRSPRLVRRYWAAFSRNFLPFSGTARSRFN